MTTVRDIETFLYAWAPRETAESWDNVGLLVGRGDREIRRVLAALDVTPAVAAEAAEADSQGAAAAALSARHAVSSYDHWHNQRGPGMEKPTVRLWRLVGFSIGNTPER